MFDAELHASSYIIGRGIVSEAAKDGSEARAGDSSYQTLSGGWVPENIPKTTPWHVRR